MTKNANFGPNLVIFGQKSPILTGESKSFVTHIKEKDLSTLFALFFGRAWDEMGQKCQYLTQNDQKCIFWTKFGVLGPKILILREEAKVLVPTQRKNHLGTFFASFLVSHGSKWAKNGNIWPKKPNLAIYGPKILIFMGVCKSFGTHITEKPPRELVWMVFWSGIGSNGPKMHIFGQKCQF